MQRLDGSLPFLQDGRDLARAELGNDKLALLPEDSVRVVQIELVHENFVSNADGCQAKEQDWGSSGQLKPSEGTSRTIEKRRERSYKDLEWWEGTGRAPKASSRTAKTIEPAQTARLGDELLRAEPKQESE
jgi:hypothetical protein